MKWEKKEEEGEKKRWKCGWIIINLGGVSDAEWREYSGPHYSPGATREEGNGKESINHSFDSSFIPSFLFLLSSFLIIARFLLFFLSFYTLIFVFHTFFCLGLLSSSNFFIPVFTLPTLLKIAKVYRDINWEFFVINKSYKFMLYNNIWTVKKIKHILSCNLDHLNII